jgi:hypothetical protein
VGTHLVIQALVLLLAEQEQIQFTKAWTEGVGLPYRVSEIAWVGNLKLVRKHFTPVVNGHLEKTLRIWPLDHRKRALTINHQLHALSSWTI